MKTNKPNTLIMIAGRGILGGFGVGAIAFGLFFISNSFSHNEFNIGALIALLSGLFCTFMSFEIKPKNTNNL